MGGDAVCHAGEDALGRSLVRQPQSLRQHDVAHGAWPLSPPTLAWGALCELAYAWSHRTNSISLGRHSWVKNGSSGL